MGGMVWYDMDGALPQSPKISYDHFKSGWSPAGGWWMRMWFYTIVNSCVHEAFDGITWSVVELNVKIVC
jgi:hypothetical protein